MIIIQAHDTNADVNALSFAPDGSRLASSGSDDLLKVWDVAKLADATPVWMADATEFGMSHLQYSPDGALIFTCGGNSARVWPAGGGESQVFAPDPRGRQPHTSVLVCSTDGRYVAWTGGYLSSPARIFTATVADRAFHRRLSGHQNAVGILAAGPDGLVSGSADRWIKFWSWESGREYHALGTRGYVRSLAVARAGDKLAAACAGTVYVWPLELPPSRRGRRLPGKPVELRGHTKATLCVDFSPDGTRLASASEDGTVRVWDATTGGEIRAFNTRLGTLHWVAFAPDGLTVAFSSQKGHVGLLDVDT